MTQTNTGSNLSRRSVFSALRSEERTAELYSARMVHDRRKLEITNTNVMVYITIFHDCF